MLPVMMRLRVRSQDGRGISLWIPVILLWILLGALMIVAFPVLFLAALLTWSEGPGMRLLLIYPMLAGVLWNLSGLHVETHDADQEVLISFR